MEIKVSEKSSSLKTDNQILISITEDQKVFRLFLCEELSKLGDLKIVECFTNGKDLIDFYTNNPKSLPDLFLVDIEMPIMDGIQAVQKLTEIYPDLIMIMLTVSDDEDHLLKAIQAGAKGYILKEESIEMIRDQVKMAVNYGSIPFSSRMASFALSRMKSNNQQPSTKDLNSHTETSNLSEREFEILELLSEGKTSQQIADSLFISSHTVRKHMSNIYTKMKVNSKTEAVKVGFLKGWFKK